MPYLDSLTKIFSSVHVKKRKSNCQVKESSTEDGSPIKSEKPNLNFTILVIALELLVSLTQVD